MSKYIFTILFFMAPNISFAESKTGIGDLFTTLIFIVIVIWVFRVMLAESVEAKMKEKNKEIMDKEIKERRETEKQKELANKEITEKQIRLSEMTAAFDSSYLEGRKWLAEFIAESQIQIDNARALELERKKNPAKKAAEELRKIAIHKKEIITRLKLAEYTIKTYHEYYPVLEQYSEDILNENATLDLSDEDEDQDRAIRYISKEEYNNLSISDRNQLALDNWRKRGKSNVEIGRFYERYIGYLYEKDGWDVTYFGATQGLEDMGRDLICRKNSLVHVVQAKNWAKFRTIHEKHIFQLYGTTILLPLTFKDDSPKTIIPVFVTTTNLSDTASWAAERLQVRVRYESMNFEYPMIKCNVNGTNKIYHLPFDQQYDRVKIENIKGEFYANTVAEAEQKGFRRAYRFHGN